MIFLLQIDPNRPPFKDLNEQLGQIEEHLKTEEESENLKKNIKEETNSNLEVKTVGLNADNPVKNGKFIFIGLE